MLVDIVQKSGAGYNGNSPNVLLISPISVGDIRKSEYGKMFGYESSVSVAKDFAKHYKRIADQLGCDFLDAAQVVNPSPVDAIHFDITRGRFFC